MQIQVNFRVENRLTRLDEPHNLSHKHCREDDDWDGGTCEGSRQQAEVEEIRLCHSVCLKGAH